MPGPRVHCGSRDSAEQHRRQRKRIEICDVRLEFGQLFARYFGYILSSLPLGLGLLRVAFDPRKQGWHDKLANAVVIGNTSKLATPDAINPHG